MKNTATPDFDVAIIGGGPAGASIAAYLAKANVDCVVFEREIFPRPHVGESLVPSSTRVFNELGFLPAMEEAGFLHKQGVIWTATSKSPVYDHDWAGLQPDCRADIAFAERAQEGIDQNYTYHVDRAIFDNLLLHHAHRLGAKVYEGVSVKRVDFSDPDHVTIRYGMGRRDAVTTARMVIDASGRRTMLGNQMKWRIKDPVFDQYALHTWFDGYNRDIGTQAGKGNHQAVHFLPLPNSWVWQIPITDTVTSIGVVTQKKYFPASREDREKFFWESVGTRPELYEALRSADQVRPIKMEGDYSYAMKQTAGDRLVLLGDAGRFVDPIFSTGVSIALNSARLAAPDIIRAIESGDFRREAFSAFETTHKRGVRNWYNFISVYYRLNVLFTAFISDPRYRIDILKLLQGDVYDEDEPAVLDRMRDLVAEVERDPRHLWHQLLGDLTAHAFAPDLGDRGETRS